MTNRKVKVLILSSMSKYSGGEVFISRLMEDNDHIDATFVLPKGDFFEFLKEKSFKVISLNSLTSIKHQSISFRFLFFVKNFFLLLNIVLKDEYDVLIANSSGMAIYSGCLAIISGKKSLYIHHHPVFNKSNKRYWIYNILVILNNSTVAVSNAVKKSFCKKRYIQKKVIIIYNGISLDSFKEIVSSLEYDKKGFFNIALVATITSWKGQHIAIEALKILKDNGMIFNIKLYFIGEILNTKSIEDKAYYNQITQRIKEYDIEDMVVFTGRINDIRSIYKDIEIVLNCSVEPEPFGTTIYEAMGFGKIVVASNLGGTPEIISDCINGFLYQHDNPKVLADIIQKIFMEGYNLNEIKENAKRFVIENLDIVKTRNNYNNLLDELTKRK